MRSEKHFKRQYYDKFYRNEESKKFYKSALWLKVKRMKLARDPLCETCKQAGRVVEADVVHHLVPLKKGIHNLDMSLLVSLCHCCHNQVESEMEKEEKKR